MVEVKTYRDLYKELLFYGPVLVEIDGLDVTFSFCGVDLKIEMDDTPHFSNAYYKLNQLKRIIELISTPFSQREFDEFKMFVENGCEDKQEEEQTKYHNPEDDLSEDERVVLDYLKDSYHENYTSATKTLAFFYGLFGIEPVNLSEEMRRIVTTYQNLPTSRKDKIVELLAIAGDKLR